MQTLSPAASKKKNNDPPPAPISFSWDSVKTYCKGVKQEWGKISWPTVPQIWGQTIVVLIMVTLVTLGLFVLDYSFHFLISSIVPHRS